MKIKNQICDRSTRNISAGESKIDGCIIKPCGLETKIDAGCSEFDNSSSPNRNKKAPPVPCQQENVPTLLPCDQENIPTPADDNITPTSRIHEDLIPPNANYNARPLSHQHGKSSQLNASNVPPTFSRREPNNCVNETAGGGSGQYPSDIFPISNVCHHPNMSANFHCNGSRFAPRTSNDARLDDQGLVYFFIYLLNIQTKHNEYTHSS